MSSSAYDPIRRSEVAVIGLGYVGLTLAVALARAGVPTVGVERDRLAAESLRNGSPHFHEPGLAQELAALPDGRLQISTTLPDPLPPNVVICVGTPVDAGDHRPRLDAFDSAVAELSARIGPDTLVVVRSTAPVGTARERVLPALAARVAHPLLAVCPERTIQGVAMREVRELPQVIGGIDEASGRRADELFAHITRRRVQVSSPEAAEMVKLVNNAHTDIIYGFGNEVAAIAGGLGLDADEVIAAANVDYPRPDLSSPGYVGGSCLTKDPYLLMHSASRAGVRPALVRAAREVNEAVPGQVVDLLLAALERAGRPPAEAKVLVCGMAYKGRPATDDVRGAASRPVAERLTGRVRTLAGHDFLVPEAVIAGLGYTPTSLPDGLADADAVLLLVDHPGYADLDPADVIAALRPPAVVVDLWGLLREGFEDNDKVTYVRWGRG